MHGYLKLIVQQIVPAALNKQFSVAKILASLWTSKQILLLFREFYEQLSTFSPTSSLKKLQKNVYSRPEIPASPSSCFSWHVGRESGHWSLLLMSTLFYGCVLVLCIMLIWTVCALMEGQKRHLEVTGENFYFFFVCLFYFGKCSWSLIVLNFFLDFCISVSVDCNPTNDLQFEF